MRLGFTSLRGSNPRASAPDLGIRAAARAPRTVSAAITAIDRPAGQAAENLAEHLAVLAERVPLLGERHAELLKRRAVLGECLAQAGEPPP
jgi:hypothetical protein